MSSKRCKIYTSTKYFCFWNIKVWYVKLIKIKGDNQSEYKTKYLQSKLLTSNLKIYNNIILTSDLTTK